MKILRLIPLLLVAIILQACDRYYADPLTRAENALEHKDYELAQTIADSIISGQNFTRLGTTQLCRTALVYAKLSEQREQDANMGAEALCMRRASELDSDSVELFVQQLNVDDQAAIYMPRKLGNVTQYELIPDESADSAAYGI